MASKTPPSKSASGAPLSLTEQALLSIRVAEPDPTLGLARQGLLGAWRHGATLAAEVGLRDEKGAPIDAEQATRLLADLLPYPEHSHPRSPRHKSNTNWWGHCLAHIEGARREKKLENLGYPLGGSCSPYPALFAAERIAALGRLGADPDASRALLRATFRKSAEELRAVMALPGCPRPGRAYADAGSALHRASYQGPNEIFALLARSSHASDWVSQDSKGRVPLEMAIQANNLGRVSALAQLTSWPLVAPDAQGNTPMHRLAAAANRLGDGFAIDGAVWSKSLDSVVAAFGPDVFTTPNLQGQSALALATHPVAKQAFAAAHARAVQVILHGHAHAAPTPEDGARKARL